MDIVCDLVLLSWNHLEETQPCLESLFETTTVPSRLFIVDNGSEPAVRAFLRGVAPRGAVREVVLLQNETNEGFPRGMNRGLRASTAPFVCLLNNDLRFTPGWLEELIAVARANPEVGVVNPESSTFGNRPPSGMSLDEYARRLRGRRGAFTEVGMCIGFCFLIKRELIERIGGLSEEVERIFFEDEDFSMRVQEAGYRCVVAAGSYVWHAEHQTVKRMPERERLFSRNQRWCEERWGRRLRLAWPRFTPLAPGSEELRRWLEQLLRWVRRRNHVYAFGPWPKTLTAEAAFRSVNLVPHADIHWRPLPSVLTPASSLAMILMLRKKPFDIIVAPEPGWARLVERLQWAHRAAVIPEADEGQLLEQWRQRSRSPSSS